MWMYKFLLEDLNGNIERDDSGARDKSGRNLNLCVNVYISCKIWDIKINREPMRILDSIKSQVLLRSNFWLRACMKLDLKKLKGRISIRRTWITAPVEMNRVCQEII